MTRILGLAVALLLLSPAVSSADQDSQLAAMQVAFKTTHASTEGSSCIGMGQAISASNSYTIKSQKDVIRYAFQCELEVNREVGPTDAAVQWPKTVLITYCVELHEKHPSSFGPVSDMCASGM